MSISVNGKRAGASWNCASSVSRPLKKQEINQDENDYFQKKSEFNEAHTRNEAELNSDKTEASSFLKKPQLVEYEGGVIKYGIPEEVLLAKMSRDYTQKFAHYFIVTDKNINEFISRMHLIFNREKDAEYKGRLFEDSTDDLIEDAFATLGVLKINEIEADLDKKFIESKSNFLSLVLREELITQLSYNFFSIFRENSALLEQEFAKNNK